jgi:carbonic anhydrase/acetyltransferase-like protein (isoleucine patch superfamily)
MQIASVVYIITTTGTIAFMWRLKTMAAKADTKIERIKLGARSNLSDSLIIKNITARTKRSIGKKTNINLMSIIYPFKILVVSLIVYVRLMVKSLNSDKQIMISSSNVLSEKVLPVSFAENFFA